MTFKDYMQYKWFFTSSGKLVVGGRSAAQNDELLQRLKSSNQELIIMHTSEPGSPFTAIISSPDKVSSSDLNEAAVFTGCFSRAWRSQKKKTIIDIFSLSSLYKSNSMKTGTWGVKGKIQHKEAPLSLVLTKQKGILRAVPESTASKSSVLLKVQPGKKDKEKMVQEIQVALNGAFNQEQILSALPAGGVEFHPIKSPAKKTLASSKKRKKRKK